MSNTTSVRVMNVRIVRMSDIWDFFKKIFGKPEQSSPNQPLIHKLIERNQEEQVSYEKWKQSLFKRRLLDWLNQQYATFLLEPDELEDTIDFLNLPSSKGFVVHFRETRYTLAEAQHLLDYLKERVLTLNYKIALSETRTYARSQQIETLERHYLKPRTRWVEGEKVKQQFGNINIDLLIREEQPYRLRLSATHYQDRSYQDAEEFKGLMKVLMTQEED